MMSLTSSTQTQCDSDVEGWREFIEITQKKDIPKPFTPVLILISDYLQPKSSVLDIGCETGKNAIPLIQAGHQVTLLDIADNAVEYTYINLQQRELEKGVIGKIVGKIEDLESQYGPYDAVIGTYAFSFIPPYFFDQVMKNNVLGRVKSEGYFAGGFFGEKHSWAANSPEYTFLTIEKLKILFLSMNFEICNIEDKIEIKQTQINGTQIFHTIEIIAKRHL